MKSNKKKKKTSKKLPFRRKETGLDLAWVGAMISTIGKGVGTVSKGQEALGDTNEYGYRTEGADRLGAENMLNPIGKSGSILKSDMSSQDKLKGIGGAWLGVVPGMAQLSGGITERLNDKYTALAREDDNVQQGLNTVLRTQHIDRNIPTFGLGGDIGDPPVIPNTYFSKFGIDTVRLSTDPKARYETMKGIVQFQKRDYTPEEKAYGLAYFDKVDKDDAIRKEKELQNALDLVKDNKLPELALGGPIKMLNLRDTTIQGIDNQSTGSNIKPTEDSPYSYLFDEMGSGRDSLLEYAGGGEMPDKIDKIEGNNHEQGGVNIGGRVEAEGGETKEANYIFSDRFKIDKEDAKRFDLPKQYINKTLAEVTEKISKKYELRKDDPIDKRDKKKEIGVIIGIQKQKQAIELLTRMKKLAKTNPEAFAKMQQQGMGQPRMDGSGQGMGVGQQLAMSGNTDIPKAFGGYEIPPKDKANDWTDQNYYEFGATDVENRVYDNYEEDTTAGAGILGRPADKNWFNDYLKGVQSNTTTTTNSESDVSNSSLPLYADGLSHATDSKITSGGSERGENFIGKAKTSGVTLANVFDVARGVIGSFAKSKKPNLIDAPQVNASYLDPTMAIQSANMSEATANSNISNSGIGAGSILSARLALASNAAKVKAGIHSQYDAQNSGTFNRANMFNAQMQMSKAQTNQGELRYNEQINQQEKDVKLNTIQTGLQNITENKQMQTYMANQKANQEMLLGTIGGDYVKLVRDGNTLAIVPTNSGDTGGANNLSEEDTLNALINKHGLTEEQARAMIETFKKDYK